MFSKATEYALRAVIFIAQNSSEEKKLGINEIAKGIASPVPFTAKIMQKLTVQNQIISSVRGPGGGFFITEEARELPVRAILNVMGEGILLEKCVLGLSQCSDTKPCPLHSKYKFIKRELIQLFETKTIQNLADELKGGKTLVN